MLDLFVTQCFGYSLMLYYLIFLLHFFFSKILYSSNVLNQNFEINITNKISFLISSQVFGKSPNYFPLQFNKWMLLVNNSAKVTILGSKRVNVKMSCNVDNFDLSQFVVAIFSNLLAIGYSCPKSLYFPLVAFQI